MKRSQALHTVVGMSTFWALGVGTPGVQAQAPSNDCSSAPLIGPGSYTFSNAGATADGATTCLGGGSSDQWFRYRPAIAGTLSVSVTTCDDCYAFVSVHAACPGTPGNQLACNFAVDNFCLGTSVSLGVNPENDYLIRMGGTCPGATISATLSGPAAYNPLGTGFTYQGRLQQMGGPVNVSTDFQFSLWSDVSSEFPDAQVGATQTLSSVPVANGLFTVMLNESGQFGSDPFSGASRWLQVAVRVPAGAGSFTTLAPRQPLSSTPYAQFAVQTRGLFVDADRHVGIGTSDPQHSLTIGDKPVADAQAIDVRAYSPSGPNAWQGAAAFGGDASAVIMGEYNGAAWLGGHSGDLDAWADLMINPAGGNVAVGTTAPAAGLHVKKEPANAAGTLALEGASNTLLSLFPNGYAAGRQGYMAHYGDWLYLANEHPGGHIVLSTVGGGKTIVNVLQINGGADVAEPFIVSSHPPRPAGCATEPPAAAGRPRDEGPAVGPGMVVAIHPEHVGTLRLADHAYDTTVAGIISGAGGVNPGLILKQEGTSADGEHPVAVSGRVWCWCDAAAAPIRPGDLLTTSDTPGHAMKAVDRERTAGAVLGKAMSSLEAGRGLVLVLVSLQ